MKLMNYPAYVANEPWSSAELLDVTNKFSGEVVGRVSVADSMAIEKAIAGAVAAAPEMEKMPPFHRRKILSHCVARFMEIAEELAQVLCREAGKPIRDSRVEVSRLIDTFRVAAEESVRFTGEVLPLEISERARGYQGMWKRFPVGPCSFISPYNFPLNLVAHKIAPAIAAGCPFILKPASATPISALLIGVILEETGLPKGAFSILPCHREQSSAFVADPRLKLLSFTGSSKVGWDMKAKAGKKKVVLELGGNAACIVDEGADLDYAVSRIVPGSFGYAGQSCISVQRVLVHTSLYGSFVEKLIEATQKLKVGDPKLEETDVGPMISEAEAKRVADWIDSASRRGGHILCGGKRTGNLLEPTLLADVPDDEPLCTEEAFGPVAVISPFGTFDEALRTANQSRYGLQAGVFTRDLHRAMRAWDELQVGGVVIDDIPSFRVDNMPYGGIKESGLGREGIRFAMEEMSETRMLVIRKPTKN